MCDLAIIIPHLDDAERLRRCLEALEGQVDAGVEVIVADNGSDFDLNAFAAEFDWVRFVVEPRRSAGLARNHGVARSCAGRLAFLDSDCLPAANWVRHARGLDVSNVIVGGQVSTFEESIHASGAQLFERVFAFDNRRYVTRLGFSVTANMVTSRAVFEALGGFKPDISEDVEWCRRAPGHGVALRYDPMLKVGHPARATWCALSQKWRRLAMEAFRMWGNRPGLRLLWLLRAQLTWISIARDAPRVMITRRLSGLEDRVICLKTLCKLRLTRALWMSRQALTGQA